VRDPSDPRIRRVLEAFDSQPTLSIAQLSSLVGLSRTRLQHLFKQQTGLALKTYQLEKRLQRAACLLSHTNLPVKEISHISGYRHPASFVRAFRKGYGLSPAEYRLRMRDRIG